MGVDIQAVVLAAATMFAVGAFWYMVLFPKQWGKIHGFDKLDKKRQKEMQSKMAPFYAGQLIVTIVSAYALAKLHALSPDYNIYKLAFWVWGGFVLPTQFSGVIFGGTEPKWIISKMMIMASDALAHIMAAAWVISLIQ